ncbi:MAG: pyridoxal-phosphate dependent enzyme [FCB group bacterium]|nr:pyridoxal-phosphate dependent enzyme [FCB group bacterium]
MDSAAVFNIPPHEAIRARVFREILMARQRVYAVGAPTPLDCIQASVAGEVYLKREDLSPINSYKWRGAYNRMALLTPEERERGVICASAGNHAQGVALGANRLGISAVIYMPTSTPRMKQVAVARHGGERVRIVLHGDNYDAAAERAFAEAAESGRVFIHAYDDYAVMGGQGTLADEVVMSGCGPFDVAYLQIGGGGMAAAVSCWLKAYYPNIRIVGVEGVEQASMRAAFDAHAPVALPYVDVFCDGTAVKKVGGLTYPLCAELLDELITVTNEEVCAAIQLLWEQRRCVAEPSGAMGLAGLLKQGGPGEGKKALAVVCGANMDFTQLAWVSRHASIGAARSRYYRFEIGEDKGSLLNLLESAFEGLNITEFQYGKVDPVKAYPVIGVEATPPQFQMIEERMRQQGIAFEDVTSREDVEFRIIRYERDLFQLPYFIKLEFPERAGALHDFLLAARETASICYFNYTFTGEQVGRALLGLEFETEEQRAGFKRFLANAQWDFDEIESTVLDRVF